VTEMKQCILLIEDDKDMAKLVTRVLKKEGFAVVNAYDGEEGFNKMKEAKPDLVITDIMMPKLDGRDLLKKAKADPDIKDIPILVLSAKDQQWDRELGLQLGAVEYIEKPLEVIKLLRQIRNILDKK